ncbi:hypothetical protein [Maritimibacter dapengensis]|uniref:Outer membrane beta-barrel protein n=1 Tax=Maritimibacter dapengensis TaxID=2836868 RepID=A0ABS6T5K5_9RHOB|nr:hypothetical protein [Maritimibacter dapengensis]MBV7379816.1 hypothetical protein [Maritimibacter dapengensis]
MNDNLGLGNPSPGVSALWTNRFTMGFETGTPISTFTFNAGVSARGAALPTVPFTGLLDEPFANATYVREGVNSRLELAASYRQINLDFADPLTLIDEDDELDDTDLIIDSGSRVTTQASVLFEGGLQDPFGYGIALDHNRTTYTGTTDPALFDSMTNSAEVFTRFRFSPVLEGRLAASKTLYSANDAVMTNRDTLAATAGLTYEFDPITVFEASLGYDYITETTNVPTTTVRSGFSGSLGLTREVPTGSYGLMLDSDLSINGRRNTLTASRAYELPTGSLDASLGVTRGPSGMFFPVGSLAYVYDLPRGQITAGAQRRVTTGDALNDVVRTNLNLGYTTDINQVSSLAFEADFAAVEDFGVAPVDRTILASLRATYSYELTEDWDISAGYEHRIRSDSALGRRHSNEVFVVLDYTFGNRP